MDKQQKSKIGKASRTAGKRFELFVRKHLEKQGWIISKWGNNLMPDVVRPESEEVLTWKMIPAKSQYNPFFKRIVGEGSGFPDFIAFKQPYNQVLMGINFYNLPMSSIDVDPQFMRPYCIMGVECKINGYLDKIEKEKCNWLLKSNTFSRILIASKCKKRGEIVFKEYSPNDLVQEDSR